MAKSSGSTRASVSNNPRGLNNGGLPSIRRQIATAITNGGADWGNTDLVKLRIEEERVMKEQLDKFVGKYGWEKGFNSISKSYGEGDILSSKEPIKGMQISVSSYNSGIEKGSYYSVIVAGSSVSGNASYTKEVSALNNNGKQFKSASEAIRWADKEANRINRKYRGKI